MRNRYVLITSARNEAAYIERTIRSVEAQTVLPLRWSIVSDGSTDDTDTIVGRYCDRHPFMLLYRVQREKQRSFSSQAVGLNIAYNRIRHFDFDFIGCLDADIELSSDYYENMLKEFENNAALGLAGGFIFEQANGRFRSRRFNREHSVAGAVQFFRRASFDEMGGFAPLRYGGLDTFAEIMVLQGNRMVRSFPGHPVYHNRPEGATGMPIWKVYLHNGKKDFSLGYDPLYEAAKLVGRIGEKPYFLAAFFRFLGYFGQVISGRKPSVPSQFVRFVRSYQRKRLLRWVERREQMRAAKHLVTN